METSKENFYIMILGLKVAPYSFMTVCALMMRAVVICTRSHKNVGFSGYL